MWVREPGKGLIETCATMLLVPTTKNHNEPIPPTYKLIWLIDIMHCDDASTNNKEPIPATYNFDDLLYVWLMVAWLMFDWTTNNHNEPIRTNTSHLQLWLIVWDLCRNAACTNHLEINGGLMNWHLCGDAASTTYNFDWLFVCLIDDCLINVWFIGTCAAMLKVPTTLYV